MPAAGIGCSYIPSAREYIRNTIDVHTDHSASNKVVNLKNTKNSANKWKQQKIKSNSANGYGYDRIFNRPKLMMKYMMIPSKRIENEVKISKRESVYLKTTAGPSVWDFGGMWSSQLAGVRFDMNARDTMGADKHIPVKILNGTARSAGGFLDKGWLAKANAQHGRHGPVSLFAMNHRDKSVAVFVGFAHLQNNKDVVTGIWSVGKNCRNNLDVHQSVFNIPDVLHRYGI